MDRRIFERAPAFAFVRRWFEDPDLTTNDDAEIDRVFEEVRRRGGFSLHPDGEPPTQQFTLTNVSEQDANLRY